MTYHKFISDDSNGKKVWNLIIPFSEQDLRGHISRSSTWIKFIHIKFVDILGNSKISKPDIARFLKHKILGFDIPVHNTFSMYFFNCQNKTCNNKLSLLLRKQFPIANMIPKISSFQIIHYKIKILLILESPLNIDNKLMINLTKNFSLI